MADSAMRYTPIRCWQCVDEATDTGALLTDTEGNQWYVEIALDEGVEYLVCVVDAGTDEVEDDEIISVWRKVGT